MKARPIIFSAPMIRALLEERKTQTRRTRGLERYNERPDGWRLATPEEWMAATPNRPGIGGAPAGPLFLNLTSGSMQSPVCPYGQPGDLLWVREASYVDEDQEIYYRADGECCQQIPECQCADVGKPRWRPSIHMPRWASRITLELTDVRVERAQEISEEDAKAECADIAHHEEAFMIPDEFLRTGSFPDRAHYYGFQPLWDSIHGPGAWDRNDWVWVLRFSVHKRNVDEILRQRETA